MSLYIYYQKRAEISVGYYLLIYSHKGYVHLKFGKYSSKSRIEDTLSAMMHENLHFSVSASTLNIKH